MSDFLKGEERLARVASHNQLKTSVDCFCRWNQVN